MAEDDGQQIKVGATTHLLDDNIKLLKEIGMDTCPEKPSPFLVMVVELLLLAGTAVRLFCLVYSEQIFKVTTDSFVNLFSGNPDFDMEDKQSIIITHVLVSIVIFQVIFPQIFLLTWASEEKATGLWQLVFLVVVLVTSITNQQILLNEEIATTGQNLTALQNVTGNQNLTAGPLSLTPPLPPQARKPIMELNLPGFEPQLSGRLSGNCDARRTCFHNISAYYTNGFLILLCSLYALRVAFHFRMREILTSVRCVGSVIEFFSHTRVRDFFCVLTILLTIGVNLSGMVRFTEYTIDNFMLWRNLSFFWELMFFLLDLASNLLCVLGMCGILYIYINNHNKYSHGKSVISTDELETRLQELVTKNREVLERSRYPSSYRYCPLTRTVKPVVSKQFIKYRD